MDASSLFSGVLHVTVAFDWGEEIDLPSAALLYPAEQQTLPRRRRTPPSIDYQTPPLLMKLAEAQTNLTEIGPCAAHVEATVFDFGAAAVTLHIPFALQAWRLTKLAAELGASGELVEIAKAAAKPVFDRIARTITRTEWSDLYEEYFVFQFLLDERAQFSLDRLLGECADWLAGLLRLDDALLSADEIAEATRLRISYSRMDLVAVEWAAAIIVDSDCAETLRAIEFANVQLLEMRVLDRRVDRILNQAYDLIHPLSTKQLPFWTRQTKPLRMLGDMRIDTVVLFERMSGALKLVGDQYLSRLYRLLATRFRLDEWSHSIHTSLDAAEGVYEVLAQQSAGHRIELLEVVVVLLILAEIIIALVA